MKKTTYIVVKNDIEVARKTTRKAAEILVSQIGGMIVAYTKE